ncbi:MAG: DUF86 domain-containing protein [Deltaproteobacteria bacterium]|nr:DUF86 domain-containing protein [Deltaproteobacteria bacterium]
MADNVLLNKAAIIERCIQRIQEEYQNNDENLANFTKQDSIILNLERACEAAVDIASRIIRLKKLGIPQDSRQAFEILEQAKIISTDLALKMKHMVGFRNIAVHDYQGLNLEIIKSILKQHLSDLSDLANIAIHWAS